jgi:hypothetical protein
MPRWKLFLEAPYDYRSLAPRQRGIDRLAAHTYVAAFDQFGPVLALELRQLRTFSEVSAPTLRVISSTKPTLKPRRSASWSRAAAGFAEAANKP